MNPTHPVNEDFLAAHRAASVRFGRRLLLGMSLALAVLGTTFACVVTQPVVTTASNASPWTADPKRLEAHVRFLATDCRPRDWSSPVGLAKAGAYIAEAFQRSGGRTWKQVFDVRGREFTNYGVTFGPENGARLIVGAHYDAHGDLPAADDNASGVAGLLELAGRLGSDSPGCRVDLVAYNA